MKRGVAALIVVAALSTAACTDRLEGKVGEDLFLAGCAHCHGADLGGGGVICRTSLSSWSVLAGGSGGFRGRS